MNKRRSIIISIVGIVLVLLILLGLTYGYYLTRINGNTNDTSVTLSIADLELTYDDGNGTITASEIVPGEPIDTKTFTVTNTGTAKVENYAVYLETVTNTFSDKEDVVLTLTCTSSDSTNCNGNNMIYPSDETLLVVNDIEVGVTHSYELEVVFKETNNDQSDNMNKTLSGNVIIKDLKSTDKKETLLSGTNTLEISNATTLSNYRIYGNSVQESTNLINELTIDTTRHLSIGGTEFGSANTATYSSTEYIKVSPNTTYIKSGGYGANAQAYFDADKNFIGSAISVSEDVEFITPVNCEYIVFNLAVNSAPYTNLQLIQVAPTPESPIEILSVGDYDELTEMYKIPIKLTGKNIIPSEENNVTTINGVTIESNNGVYHFKGTATSLVSYRIYEADGYKIKAGDYIMSGSLGGDRAKTYFWRIYTGDKSYEQDDSNTLVSYSEDVVINYVVIYVRPGATVDVSIKPQLELGSVATDFEPYKESVTNIYLEEPLRKIGNYSDYIDFESGKVVRNIKNYVVTGTESWAKAYDTLNNGINAVYQMYNKSIKMAPSYYTKEAMSNYLSPVTGSDVSNKNNPGITTIPDATYVRLRINNSSYNGTTVNEFKTWLQDRYNQSNPFKINYVLSSNIISDANIPQLMSLGDFTKIEVQSNITPSKMEVEYIG